MIGFDFARTFNPAHRIGTATGIVNVGGFIAALVAIFLIGLVLDVLLASGYSQGVLYGLEPFRIALSVQFLLLGFGAAMTLVCRRKVRRQMAAQGVVVPPLLQAMAQQRRANLARRRQPDRAPTDRLTLVLHIGLSGPVVHIAEARPSSATADARKLEP